MVERRNYILIALQEMFHILFMWFSKNKMYIVKDLLWLNFLVTRLVMRYQSAGQNILKVKNATSFLTKSNRFLRLLFYFSWQFFEKLLTPQKKLLLPL